jgi:hypothetical protein
MPDHTSTGIFRSIYLYCDHSRVGGPFQCNEYDSIFIYLYNHLNYGESKSQAGASR